MPTFWLLVLIGVLTWYTFITIYVGIRGAFDIRGMLRELGNRRDDVNQAKR